MEGMGPLRRKLDGARAALGNLDRVLLRAGLVVAARAQRNVTGGGHSKRMLNVRTGRLRGSIHAAVVKANVVKVGTNVIYAPIHEFGGTIVPRRAKFLRFQTDDGAWHSVKRVVIPPRPYLGPAMVKERERVVKMIRAVYAGPLHLGSARGGGAE